MWPYVNGKALFNGLNLKEMEASDMLDVIHFLFEEDRTHSSEDHMKSQSSLRVALYSNLYRTTYKYEYKDPKSKSRNYDYSYDPENDFGILPEEESVKPFNPRELQGPAKAYVPATSFDPTADNPFGGVLDAPMN